MNSGKQKLLMLCAIVVFSLTAVSAFSQVNLGNNTNWKVYNVMPATKSFWDINKAVVAPNGLSLSFPIQQYLSPSTGSFAVYLLANYNNDITGKTLTTSASWTSGFYNTRSTLYTAADAYVRFEFQDVASGPYDANDYWWSTGANSSLDLNTGTSGTLTVPTNPALWSNICGHSATDTNVYPDCITGAQITMSPAAGFANAMKNVKQLGLSFGNTTSSYASGVALVNYSGTFTVTKFAIN